MDDKEKLHKIKENNKNQDDFINIEPEKKEEQNNEKESNINEIENISNNNGKEETLKSINDLIEMNYKINNDIINIIKRNDINNTNEIDIDIFNKLLIANNKKILAYKLFCLYRYYSDNNTLRKKIFLRRWNKMI